MCRWRWRGGRGAGSRPPPARRHPAARPPPPEARHDAGIHALLQKAQGTPTCRLRARRPRAPRRSRARVGWRWWRRAGPSRTARTRRARPPPCGEGATWSNEDEGHQASGSRGRWLSPTTPHRAAGCRMDPPVSEPRATGAIPAATAAADPPDDPPGTRSRSHGLRVGLNALARWTSPWRTRPCWSCPRPRRRHAPDGPRRWR